MDSGLSALGVGATSICKFFKIFSKKWPQLLSDIVLKHNYDSYINGMLSHVSKLLKCDKNNIHVIIKTGDKSYKNVDKYIIHLIIKNNIQPEIIDTETSDKEIKSVIESVFDFGVVLINKEIRFKGTKNYIGQTYYFVKHN